MHLLTFVQGAWLPTLLAQWTHSTTRTATLRWRHASPSLNNRVPRRDTARPVRLH